MHYYWYLTDDGIEFLRTYLNLPSEIVPATLKKQMKPGGRPMGPPSDRPRYIIIALSLSLYCIVVFILNDVHSLFYSGPPRFDGDCPRFGDREGHRAGP